MIDRQARDSLAKLIESYLDEQITAFEFDEKIQDVDGKSDDEVVGYVAHALWLHYDDCKDHTVVLSEVEWNHIQRLLLLLRSDAEFHAERRRFWSWRHALALAGCAGFILSAVRLGFGMHLFIVAIPFGLLSMLVSWTRPALPNAESEKLIRLTPFHSLREILAVRRSVTGFRKKRYPIELHTKCIRSPFMDRLISFQNLCFWLLFSPVILLIQSLPEQREWTSVVVGSSKDIDPAGRHYS